MNIEVIKARKLVYGDSFQSLSNEWSTFLGRYVSPEEVAIMLSKLKQIRLQHVEDKLEKFCSEEITIDKELLVSQLSEAREDTLTDLRNYQWIAENYRIYQNL